MFICCNIVILHKFLYGECGCGNEYTICKCIAVQLETANLLHYFMLLS